MWLCMQNAPRWQQFLVAPAMPALRVHHFGGYSKTRYEKLFTHVESHASAVSLLNSGEPRYIKAINNSQFDWISTNNVTAEMTSTLFSRKNSYYSSKFRSKHAWSPREVKRTKTILFYPVSFIFCFVCCNVTICVHYENFAPHEQTRTVRNEAEVSKHASKSE